MQTRYGIAIRASMTVRSNLAGSETKPGASTSMSHGIASSRDQGEDDEDEGEACQSLFGEASCGILAMAMQPRRK